MKCILTLIVALAAFVMAESADAQNLKNLVQKAASSVNVQEKEVVSATSKGEAAGIALKELYAQYKVDGKLNVTNRKNLKNLSVLVSNIQELKGQSNKSSFYKEFASGLINGSDNLVNKGNVDSVMKTFSSMSNTNHSSSASKTEAMADALIEIFKLFEK